MGFDENTTANSGILKCEGCGALVNFEPGAQQLKCAYCGTKKEINRKPTDGKVSIHEYYDFLSTVKNSQAGSGSKAIKCNICGSANNFGNNIIAGKCSSCSSWLVATPNDNSAFITPNYLLPFAVTEAEAKGKSINRVKELKQYNKKFKNIQLLSVNGVYLPNWLFEFETLTEFKGANRYVVESSNGTGKSDWLKDSGTYWETFNVVQPAFNSLPAEVVTWLEAVDWDWSDLKVYDEKYVSGFQAQAFQISPATGLESAKQRASVKITKGVINRLGGDEQRIDSLATKTDHIYIGYILLPYWVATYADKEKTRYLIVDGFSGNIRDGNTVDKTPEGFKIFFFILKIVKFILWALLALFILGLAASIFYAIYSAIFNK